MDHLNCLAEPRVGPWKQELQQSRMAALPSHRVGVDELPETLRCAEQKQHRKAEPAELDRLQCCRPRHQRRLLLSPER